MNRVLTQIAHVSIALAILALATGCPGSNSKSNSNGVGDPTSSVPPGGDPGESGGKEDFPFVYGAGVTQEDLPLPLIDDPNMPPPSPLPAATATQLGRVTAPWLAKSAGEISALLQVEANADSQLTEGQRAAMFQLGLVPAP